MNHGEDPLYEFERRRFLFVTGKGGVGKTTVTAALAMALAERGRRVLVALSGPEEHLSAALDVAPIGNEVVEVRNNLSAVYITPAAAMSQYGAMVLKSRRVYSRLFENKYVRNFLDGVPGLNEWAVLGQAWYFTTELLDDGAPRFDTVLLDAPATGHALDMLRVPRIIVEVAPTGVLRRDAMAAWEMLQDPRRSGVVIVTLAEELPASETLELAAELRNELGLPVVGLVVNQLLPNLFTKEQCSMLLARRASIARGASPGRSEAARRSKVVGVGFSETPARFEKRAGRIETGEHFDAAGSFDAGERAAVVESGAWLTLAEVVTRRALRERLQADMLERLRAVPGPQWHLPLLSDAAEEGQLIVSLARTLTGDTQREFDRPVLRAKR